MRIDEEHLARIRRERDFFAKLARAGDELYWAEATAVAPVRRKMRSRRIAERAGLVPGEGLRILDIGCGIASYTLPLATQTAGAIVGIDVTPQVLKTAIRAVPENVRFVAADASRLPFPDQSIDAVVGNAILHHLPLEVAIPEFLRVLRPGGRICFAEPNFVNPHVFVILSVPRLRKRAGATPDESAFVRWPLQRELVRLGLTAIQIQPFDFLYPLVPTPLIGTLEVVGRFLEAIPGIREIAGSLLIYAEKPC